MEIMREKIKKIIEQNKNDFLKDLDLVLKIPSVKDKASYGAPFGKNNKKVLNQVMSLANSYGFETDIVNNAVGYAQFGNNEETIGVVGHLDVVPAGDGWDYPPYQLTQIDGILYGRGILDNKGPIMACLFGLKLLKELDVPFEKSVRIIFGTDEESGASDIPLYLDKEKPPTFGFTPDCKYPVVYGERGIVNLTITTEFSNQEMLCISEIVGDQGKAFVPDSLSCEVDGKVYQVKGKRAPSNAPELGVNAITLLAEVLAKDSSLSKELKSYFLWIISSFHEKHYGEGINLFLSDEDSGQLMITPYELVKNETGFKLSVAIRYPVSYSEKEIIDRIGLKLPSNSQLEIIRRIPSVTFPKDNSNILKMSKVYEEVTGLDGTPVTTTGATYARFMPNIVAFGPSFPGQKGIAHNANEYMSLEDLLTNMEIYMLAMYKLARNN